MRCKTHKCKACCCYNIPFERGELERFADRIVTPVRFTLPLGRAKVAFTHDEPSLNRCPFLRLDFRCNIYDQRPEVCRLFGEIPALPCPNRLKKH